MARNQMKHTDMITLATQLGAAFGGGVLGELRSVRKNKEGKEEFHHTLPRIATVGFGGTYGPLAIIASQVLPAKYRTAGKILCDIGIGLTLNAVGDMGKSIMFKAQKDTYKKVPLPKKELEALKKKMAGPHNQFQTQTGFQVDQGLVPPLLGEEIVTEEQMVPPVAVPAVVAVNGFVENWANEPYPDASLYGMA